MLASPSTSGPSAEPRFPARTSYFEAYPNGVEHTRPPPRIKPKRSKAHVSSRAGDGTASHVEGGEVVDDRALAGALKHKASRSRLRDRLRSPKQSEGPSSPLQDSTPRPRSAPSSRDGRRPSAAPVLPDLEREDPTTPSLEAAVLTPLSPSSSIVWSAQSSPQHTRRSHRSSVRSSVGSSAAYSPAMYAFPTSSPDVEACETSSTSSTSDLFAGPRTSVYFDPETGELLSHGTDARAMDALVGTMRDSALPPEVRNMRRETREMQHIRDERKREEYLAAAKRKAKRKKKEAGELKRGATTVGHRSSEGKGRLEVGLGLATTLSQPDLRSVHSGASSTLVKSDSTPLNHSSGWSETASGWSKFSSPTSSTYRSSKGTHKAKEAVLDSGLPKALPEIPRSISSPLSTTVDADVPTIEDIIAKHGIQPAPRPAVLAHPSATRAIPTIDDIVRTYKPLLNQPAGRKDEPSRRREDTAADRSASSHGTKRSSLDSIADEVLHYLNVGFDDGPSRLAPPGSDQHLQRRAASEGAARLLHAQSFHNEARLRKPSKASAVEADLPPLPLSASLPSSDSNTDQELATYLRSPRLTTLLKLDRPGNGGVTVSLADVGSPGGHPVIIFLGLGCVRYLVALYDEIAEALGLRLICVDRWGLGKTTEIPDSRRGFLEWSSVVEEVADRLGLGSFSLLAHSAGAPYALATALRLDNRIKGSVHLLAPFVSMNADGGANAGNLRWLRYVPSAMIKTAQAAEWKMQGWLLGKPPTLTLEPVGYDAKAPTSSVSYKGPTLPPLPSLEPELVEEPEADVGLNVESLRGRTRKVSQMSEWSHLSRDTSRTAPRSSSTTSLGEPRYGSQGRKGFLGKVLTHRKGSGPSAEAAGSVGSSTITSPSTPTSIYGPRSPSSVAQLSRSSQERPSISSGRSAPPPPPKSYPGSLGKPAGKRMSVNSAVSDKPSTMESYSTRPTSPSSTGHSARPGTASSMAGGLPPPAPTPASRLDLGTALLKASYAESLRGGTADLLAILERNDRPWGFSYTDVRGPVKVWHGDRDERIPLASARWMELAMQRCELNVVSGADHSLMTNVMVVFDVLESIKDEWRGDSK